MSTTRLLIGVLSAAGFHDRRSAVLDTWGRETLRHEGVDLVFLIGNPDLRMPQRFGHTLNLPCPDDYRRLPQKLRWFCLWALAHSTASWLFKCDDDTYVRIDRLLAALEAGRWSQPVVGCADGRGDHFHGGAGYLMSRDAAVSIAARLSDTQGLEDWKARDALAAGGLWFEHDDRFCFDTSRRPSADNEQITCHYVRPDEMRRLHETFVDHRLISGLSVR